MNISRVLALVFVVACARQVAPPAAPIVVAPAIAPADAALIRWRAILADDAKPPAGTTVASLVQELVAYLGSPDPERRDRIAYDVLEAWIGKQARLTDDEVRALATQLIANLSGPLDEPDGVFRRSFSALVLATIVRRDFATPFLDDTARRAILTAARDFALRETDLRGHTGVHGWAHAAAHAADLLAQLARLPTFTDEDRGIVLDAVGALTVRRHGAILHYGEDGRLAVAVIRAAAKGVAPARLEAWLKTLVAPLLERLTPTFDVGLFAAQRNARNLLFTLFVQTSLTKEPSEGERHLLDAIRSIL